MGHVWLGFERGQMTGWLTDAGFNQVKFGRIATGTTARGPSLFAAVGVKTIEERT
jgi:hypothetical protein